MKNLVSILLCISVIFGMAVIPGTAQEPAYEWDGDPVVFIQGFTGSPLIMDKGLETEQTILGAGASFDIQRILTAVPGLLAGIAVFAVSGDGGLLLNSFKYLAGDKLDKMSVKADGTSRYNVSTFPYYATEASVASLKAADKEEYIPEAAITGAILEYVPEDNLFIFNCDWRMGQIDNSAQLNRFIDEVLKLTGKAKVDIYALSHGGQVAATYLYYYGTQGKVDNAVLNVPAIGGTTIATGLLSSNVNFGMDEISRFLAVMLHTETDLRWLGKILPGEFLNNLINVAFGEVFLPYALHFGSIWDFMDINTYTEMKEKYLNPLAHAQMIEKHDKMHYDCMANMSRGLNAAQDAGANIYIMSNFGTQLGTGEAVDSDFIIDTSSTSGAYVAEYGTRFDSSYVQKNTVCTDPTHNHISPCRTVDASCAYLPEKTWFIRGQYHGQVMWDDYTDGMIIEMLLTDNIADVHSDSRYPQFELAQNPVDAVYASFSNEKSGFFSSESNTLIIRNLSEEYDISIRSITADGCEFDIDKERIIAPGEEIAVTCTKLSDEDFFALEITYVRKGEFLSSPFTKTVYFSAA